MKRKKENKRVVYTAETLEESKVLGKLYEDLEELDRGGSLGDAKQENLLAFSKSVANESIQQASRFHQESHIKNNLESQIEMTTSA